jgi:hypothetical protein
MALPRQRLNGGRAIARTGCVQGRAKRERERGPRPGGNAGCGFDQAGVLTKEQPMKRRTTATDRLAAKMGYRIKRKRDGRFESFGKSPIKRLARHVVHQIVHERGEPLVALQPALVVFTVRLG